MKTLSKEAIRIITLWRSHGPGTTKIDLEVAFKELILPTSAGDTCSIVYDSFESFEGLMAREKGSKRWKIGVSDRISYGPRKNFTLAHEIGHFIGHRYKQDIFQCTFENLNDFQVIGVEKEANEFAAQLLMPADVVRKYDKENQFRHETISELASTLGVSRSAAAFRWIDISTRKVGFAISRDGFICSGRSSDRLYKAGMFFNPVRNCPQIALRTVQFNWVESLEVTRVR